VIVLEGDAAAVVPEIVGFDHDPLRAPGKVDRPFADASVHLRPGQAVVPAEAQEVPLEVAARAVGFDATPQPHVGELRLPDRPPEEPRSDGTAQVLDRPRRSGHRDAATDRDEGLGATLGSGERGTAVQSDTGPAPDAGVGGDRDVDRAGKRPQQPPQGSGAAMTEHRQVAVREHRGHPAPRDAHREVPD
jgi:hypothetical protein